MDQRAPRVNPAVGEVRNSVEPLFRLEQLQWANGWEESAQNWIRKHNKPKGCFMYLEL